MENHVHTLIQQLKDESPHIRKKSILALKVTDIASYRHEVIVNLLDLLEDAHLAVRDAAEDALVALGNRDVVEALIPCLSDSSTTVLNYAIEILSRIGNTAIDNILPLLESKDHDIRKFGCDILGNLKYADGVFDLIELLNDPHVNVAIAAGEAGKTGKSRSGALFDSSVAQSGYLDEMYRCRSLREDR